MVHLKRVAYLTAQSILTGGGWDPSEVTEHTTQVRALMGPCRARGIELCPVAWDQEGLDPGAFEALVIGTTWDYAARAEEFLARLQIFSNQRPLLNSLSMVRWNIDKAYLKDLELRGIPTLPTLWRAVADGPTIAAAFEELGTDHLVIKPTVGQTAWRQVRLKRGEALPSRDLLPPAATMIQAFQPAIMSEGELSFVFIDGTYSHCVLKRPARGDYRIQGTWGGTEHHFEPSKGDIRMAQDVIDALSEIPLFGRIDMLRAPSGELCVMECELIEPYLYPVQGPSLGPIFAEGLQRRLES